MRIVKIKKVIYDADKLEAAQRIAEKAEKKQAEKAEKNIEQKKE